MVKGALERDPITLHTNDVIVHDPMLERIIGAGSFEDPALSRQGQWRFFASLMWEKLSEEQRHEVYFTFMGKQYDSEE